MQFNIFEAYKIAIETRNLEIKLFWQRSLFFAAFISAIFLGYSRKDIDSSTKLLLSSFGFLLTFAWLLANRGSKYWYESWESKINEIERNFSDKLFEPWQKPQKKNFLYQGRLYSVSKIAIYVTDLILVGWLIILSRETLSYFKLHINFERNGCVALVIFIVALLVALGVLLISTRTTVPKEVKEQWKQ